MSDLNDSFAYINGIILDGTEYMTPVENKVILVDGARITDICDKEKANLKNRRVIDLKGRYIMPGLINLHVHLTGNGGHSKKPRDSKKLVSALMSHRLTRNYVFKRCQKYAALELYSGVTTIRTVGGLEDFDTAIRDAIDQYKLLGPRMIVSNQAIMVRGGHMDGTVAQAAGSCDEAVAFVDERMNQKADLIKLMVTGDRIKGTEKEEGGEKSMPAEMIKACCDEAHKKGYKAAAHVKDQQGLIEALESGVDTIEHGAGPDPEGRVEELFKQSGAALITTISPAVPYAEFDPKVTGANDVKKHHDKIILDGIVACSKMALKAGIPVGLGNDAGCPFISQYNFWRELVLFAKYCSVTNRYALYTAMLGNARIAGIDTITGSIEKDKSADFIVTKDNPLHELSALRNITDLSIRGRYIKNPQRKIRRKKSIEKPFDKAM